MSDGFAGWIDARMSKLLKMKTYSGGKSLYIITKRLGVDMESLVKLNSNENFFLPRSLLAEKMHEITEELDVRIYPQFEVEHLTEKLARWLSVSRDKVLIGNGSDQLLEIISRVFLRGGKDAVSISPTFTMYRVLVALEGGRYTQVPLRRDFSLDADALLEACSENTTLCFLCSPNNPTGNQFKYDVIRGFIERFKGVVVLDEAYADFSDYQMYHLVDKLPNLIVVRTFSKLFAMAGLRLGYTVANPRLTKVLSKLQQPYAVSTVTLRFAIKMLDELDAVREACDRMRAERERLRERLSGTEGVTPFRSDANFILFKTDKPAGLVMEELIRRGVVVRHIRNVLHLGDCLRTTVGLPVMNERLLNALEDINEVVEA